MTRAPRLLVDVPVSDARIKCVNECWKNLAQSQTGRRGARQWFAELLWVAFPAKSERELCRSAARALGCSERQVGNWLRCDNDASVNVVTRVMIVAGAEVVFQKMEGAIND
ncbi:hypothetical protein [Phaeobacter gallaeciensis]|uniref:hypothetical protein n=1 Tax=Phaeobacter gallaeciensis TaxID=60890 RepID=UPI00237FB90F|nr:hypothetical protein [Phaeobacter gallaeciensis]MDE4189638.1 hypothetical protein [Phaeobacter gallaeciensis]MDE4198790.1 hypothetical protein [Phaeobacter gallaeciensis]MDE4202936.1 hypothetical protein [Phaeobacter gallaeciensis]MDE4207079.1 hypothetical protein [Phaeobacter gallaeciensis]MDE4215696.1 hypothetical protein [Phaeobacter gallaeciensis]